MFIGISGIIGAGKTTLTQELADALQCQAVYEPVEENRYLKDFYTDSQRWSFAMQIELLSRRFDLHQKVIWLGKNAVQDRTIYEDTIFATVLYQQGLMDERDFENYMRLFNVMRRFLVYPDVIVYLDVPPETALKRIQSRGRECEQTITLGYLAHLQKEYEKYIVDISRFVQVLRVDWSQFRSPEPMVQDLLALTKRESLFFKNIRRI